MAQSFAVSICIVFTLGISRVYTQERHTFAAIPKSATWETAREQCENVGKRLCLRKDLCRQTPTSMTLKRTITNSNRDTWIAVADEYNDWLYLGPQSKKVCEKLSQLDGPPLWDEKDCASLNEKRLNKKAETFCSNSKGVYCCQDDKSTSLPVSQKTAVYIKSRMEDDTPYYHFSLSQFQTEKDWGRDKASWRNGGRLEGDLSKITLMSGFVEGKYEDPIFFCVQSVSPNKLLTTSHKVSKRWCTFPWKLDFYLYGSYSEVEGGDSEKYLIGMKEAGTDTHSRISLEEDPEFRTKFNIYGPKDADGQHKEDAEKATKECQRRPVILTQKTGVISSPNYPNRFNSGRREPVECEWKIKAPSKSIIKITFKTLKLSLEKFRDYTLLQFSSFQGKRITEYNFNKLCPTDMVKIDGYGTFCGTQLPPSFATTSNEVDIAFLAKRGSFGVGFAIYYEMIDPPAGFTVLKISEADRQSFVWEWGKETCEKHGKSMCAANDICKFSRPFYGVKEGDQWAPIGDEYNDWVQIGRGNVHTCQRHNKAHGPPQWGVTPRSCQTASWSRPCPKREYLYCCDAPAATLSDESSSITVQVYSTVQNGVVFFKYLREGIDDVGSFGSSMLWSAKRKRKGDFVSFRLREKRSPGYDKIVYFCSQKLVPAVAALQTAYGMFLEPCETLGWKFLYSLYAMNDREKGARKLFVGVYQKTPHHTRAHFNNFPDDFKHSRGYVLYAFGDEKDETDEDVETDDSSFACTGGLTVLQGTSILESPGYPTSYKNNANCKWIFLTPMKSLLKGDRLKITIEELSLEDPVDVLSIFEISHTLDLSKTLPDAENLQIFKNRKDFTGKVGDVSMETSIGFFLSFKSDGSVTDKGFRIRSEVAGDECGGHVIKSGDVISSPNYPKRYNGDTKCKWMIKAPSDSYNIELEFNNFDLLPDDSCSDKLRVLGLDSGIRLFCGGAIPPKQVVFDEHILNITFNSKQRPESERSTGGKGFEIRVHFRKKKSFPTDNEVPQCGIQSVPFQREESASDRIVGGKVAVEGNFPWMVMIGRPSLTCGGTLLSTRWVLSATHCFVDSYIRQFSLMVLHEPLKNFIVIAGRYQRDIISPGEQIFNITELVIHGGFERYSALWRERGRTVQGIFPYNDIAMAKLSEEAVFSPTIRPACLPTQDTHVGDFCYVSGWGSKSPDRMFMTSAINYARVPILDNSLCNSWDEIKGTIMENSFCAGFPKGGTDHCWGDSGGPLTCRGRYGNFYVNGIVSWSRECAGRRTPGVYTRVWKYVDWIKDIMKT